MSPLFQTCLVGFAINAIACLVILHLWSRARSEVQLLAWAGAHALSTARWIVTYAAARSESPALMLIVAIAAAASMLLIFVGTYSLVPDRHVPTKRAAAYVALAFLAVIIAGKLIGELATAMILAAVGMYFLIGWYFLRLHRHRPLSAYWMAAIAAAAIGTTHLVGWMILGPAYTRTVLLPLTGLPVAFALVLICHQRSLQRAIDSEVKFRRVIDTVPVPITLTRPPRGEVEQINQAALQVFGGEAGDYLGRSSPDSGPYIEPKERERMYAELAAGKDVKNREFEYLRRDRGPVIMSVNASSFDTADGPRCVFALYDLTEFRRVETELRTLNATLEQQVSNRTRDLEAFSYTVAHDLRTPLRAIDAGSALLEKELGDDLTPPARGYIARIREGCARMNTLINALLDLSRLSNAALKYSLVDLSAMAERISEDLSRTDPARRVRWKIEPWVRITADETTLRIVMDNLLGNAWKYTASKDAEIEFSTRRSGDTTTYVVRDNGIGFDMRESDRLFQPFQRLSGSEGFDGTGVGLATVARIVRNHGGSLWAEASPGQGATFYFTLGDASNPATGPATFSRKPA